MRLAGMTKPNYAIAPLAALMLLAACSSPEGTAPSEGATEVASAAASAAVEAEASASASPTASPSASPSPAASVLRLEGLGDLEIGKPVPAGSRFASRGAQIPGSGCVTISSPDYPGVYAITEGGTVRRITVGGVSKIKLIEGIGVGSSEADVLREFAGFKSEPHKYVAAPAKYLTQPGSDPRLRFEIGDTRRVTMMHVGTQPQLTYVEGCA